MTSPFSLAVATPTRSGSFCMDYVGSVLELQHQCLARGIDFRFLPLVNVTLIDLARNTLANRFLWETSCTHLLFVDDDMGFHAGELARMFALPGDAATMSIGHEPVRMSGIPTGLMMISRECLMKLVSGGRVSQINPGTEVNGQVVKREASDL